MDKFDFSTLKRKYTTDRVNQEQVLRQSDTPYVEFDEPINMVIDVRGNKLYRNVGLISPYGILYADSSCFITITSPWSISCEGYGEIIPYDDQFKFMEWARRIKNEVDGQQVILSDEEDLVI